MTTQAKQAKSQTASSFALGFIVICIVGYLLNVASAIMIPLVIAIFVWYLINGLARGLERIDLGGRRIKPVFCFALAIMILMCGLWFVYEMITANASDVMRAAPVYQKKLTNFVPQVLGMIPEAWRPNPSEITQYLDVAGVITALVRTFTGIAGKAVVVIFYTGFLLYEQKFFGRKIKAMFSTMEGEKKAQDALRNIDYKVQRYIWVKTIVSVIIGIVTWIIAKSFSVDFAEFWGVMAFILNFIPYVGALIATALPVIVALVQTGDPSVMMTVLGFLCLAHALLGHVLDPFLMGSNLNLSPIFIITNLAIWEMIWGVPGMFLAIPILAIIVIILAQFPSTRPFAILMTKTGNID